MCGRASKPINQLTLPDPEGTTVIVIRYFWLHHNSDESEFSTPRAYKCVFTLANFSLLFWDWRRRERVREEKRKMKKKKEMEKTS